MNIQDIRNLKYKKDFEVKTILEEFNAKNANLFDFSKLRVNDDWSVLWNSVFELLRNEENNNIFPLCLNTIRILTRDEHSLQTHDITNDTETLLRIAGLYNKASNDIDLHKECVLSNSLSFETYAEALKCLCNLVYQNIDCRRQCIRLHVPDAIFKRFPVFMRQADRSPCIELYIMKLLFLLTAMEPNVRARVQIDLNGISYMTEWLDEKLTDQTHIIDKQLELLCEMLKVMFNITSCTDKSPNENEIQSLHLTSVLRELIIRFGAMSTERERNVIIHAINLLTNISSGCLSELTIKCDAEDEKETPSMLCFEKVNVRVLEILLRHLHNILNENRNNGECSNELIPSVLLVLVKCARCNSIMRHYIRSIILPPLQDVTQRPEVGNDLRNHLCRFLTVPEMIIRDLAAELLFVCCKENVARMVKYTGYGNAAGLFANRGLLDCRQVENVDYSSDSEDSDTEEYKNVLGNINPILGCYEHPKVSPLEGISEEQKEYEAMELVKLMDKLHRGGIVQPCRIGEDGKPKPVDHILELQEELPQQQFEQKRKT